MNLEVRILVVLLNTDNFWECACVGVFTVCMFVLDLCCLCSECAV